MSTFEAAMIDRDGAGLSSTEEDRCQPFEFDEQLYIDVREFWEDHLDFMEEEHYDVVTAKTFETWFIFKFFEVSYIFFLGPPNSGKTRGLEVFKALSFNPKFAAYMTAPAMYRTLENEWCTLILDEIQQYLDSDKRTFMAVINAGQRRGEKAILAVRTRGGYDVREFEVFGIKILASTESTIKTLLSRSLVIPMSKAIRRVKRRVDRERAAELRKRLDAYASKNMPRVLPSAETLLDEWEIEDGRNRECFINLIELTPPLYRKRILGYAKEVDDEVSNADMNDFYAELFCAVEYVCSEIVIDPKSKTYNITIKRIGEILNDGRAEDDMIAPITIGLEMNNLGFSKTYRAKEGKGRKVKPSMLKRLKRRYNPDPDEEGQQKLGQEGTLPTYLEVKQ